MKQPVTPPLPRAGFWRRFAALVYDALLLIALLMLATALAMAVAELLSPGVNNQRPDSIRHHPLYLLWLLLWWYGYYTLSWRRGGQTVGMKAWRLQLQNDNASLMQGWQLRTRLLTGGFAMALAVAGYSLLAQWAMRNVGLACLALPLLLLFPRCAVHEKLSHTRVVLLPKTSRKAA